MAGPCENAIVATWPIGICAPAGVAISTRRSDSTSSLKSRWVAHVNGIALAPFHVLRHAHAADAGGHGLLDVRNRQPVLRSLEPVHPKGRRRAESRKARRR